MSRDHLGPAADHDFADIATNLHLVVSVGHRHRVVVAAIAHHGDRGRPRAELLAGIIRHRRQRHQRVEIPHQPLTDRLAVPPENCVLTLEALVLQPGVQRLEALEAGHRNHKIAPAKADHALHGALVVALARPAEPVLEQVMRLQLRKGPGALARAIAEDLRHRDGGVVVEDRRRHAAEEPEGRDMPVAERLGRLGRIGLDEERVRVRKRHREIVQLALDPADHAVRHCRSELPIAAPPVRARWATARHGSPSPKSTWACPGGCDSGTNTSRDRRFFSRT